MQVITGSRRGTNREARLDHIAYEDNVVVSRVSWSIRNGEPDKNLGYGAKADGEVYWERYK